MSPVFFRKIFLGHLPFFQYLSHSLCHEFIGQSLGQTVDRIEDMEAFLILLPGEDFRMFHSLSSLFFHYQSPENIQASRPQSISEERHIIPGKPQSLLSFSGAGGNNRKPACIFHPYFSRKSCQYRPFLSRSRLWDFYGFPIFIIVSGILPQEISHCKYPQLSQELFRLFTNSFNCSYTVLFFHSLTPALVVKRGWKETAASFNA